MTRINAGISPEQLTDQHLIAEHREIKRLARLFDKKKKPINCPPKFKLGEGHVLFFLNKGKFTFERYLELHKECIKRSFKVEDYSKNWSCYFEHNDYWESDWSPNERDREIIKKRIIERIVNSIQTPRYNKKIISREEAIHLLKK